MDSIPEFEPASTKVKIYVLDKDEEWRDYAIGFASLHTLSPQDMHLRVYEPTDLIPLNRKSSSSKLRSNENPNLLIDLIISKESNIQMQGGISRLKRLYNKLEGLEEQ